MTGDMTVPASGPEFSHMIDRRMLKAAPVQLEASEAQRAALALRFGVVSIQKLIAVISLEAEGEVIKANGNLSAELVQSCAISGDDLPQSINEELSMRFVPEREITDEEIELEEEDLDEIPYSGTTFDLGEAVAQSLALAIDPYAIGAEAEAVRTKHGLADEGPKGPLAAALGAALKKG